MGGGDTREIEDIVTNINMYVVNFFLGGADGGHYPCVGYLVIGWYGSFFDKKTVLVPEGIPVPTPWARRPRSLSRAQNQVWLSGPQIR